MKITGLSTQPFSLPMRGALSWGEGSTLEGLEHVLVRVHAGNHEGDEVTGTAEVPVRPTIYGETVVSVRGIVRWLEPHLIGRSLEDEEGIWNALHSVANNQAAKGALDIAIHDARAKGRGQTLFDTWRGPNEHIRVSFILGIADLKTMLAEARWVFKQGVSVFKVKVGRDQKFDEEVIGALRNEFAGEEVILYADANEGLSPGTAARDLERLAALGLAYIEEPLPIEFVKERAALREAQILPIIADDSCFSLRDLRRELALGTFDILNIKPARTGFTESSRMLALAREAGKGVMVGSQASSGLGTRHCALFASQAGVDFPSELSFPLKLEEDVVEERLEYVEGTLNVDSLSFTLRPNLEG